MKLLPSSRYSNISPWEYRLAAITPWQYANLGHISPYCLCFIITHYLGARKVPACIRNEAGPVGTVGVWLGCVCPQPLNLTI